MWSSKIDQPPPTPGLAQWAWNSLFNKQTPMAKYNAMKERQNITTRPATLDQDTRDIAADEDTFHYKRNMNHKRRYATREDEDLSRKNVSWGGQEYRVRSRSSSLVDPPLPDLLRSRSRSRDRDRDFYKEKELLPDADDDFSFTSHRPSSIRRTHSASHLDRSRPSIHTSLPQAYPGRFPSPYVHKDDLLSSGTKNLMAADANAERNRRIHVNSSPPVVVSDWKRRLGLAPSEKKRVPRQQSVKSQPTYRSHIPSSPEVSPLKEFRPSSTYPASSRSNSHSLFRKSKAWDDYSPTLDQNEILKRLDENALELDQITSHIHDLKREPHTDGSLPHYGDKNLEEKYQKVRAELISELKKSQKLYDSYYRFVAKYKDLKAKYESAPKDGESSIVRSLEKEIMLLKDENQRLKDQINEKDVKLEEDDFTLSDLKSSLQSSTKFEVTLRRKMRYLEDKLEKEREDHKKAEFQLNEKVYMLEMKSKDDDDRLKRAEERIRELELENGRLERLDRLTPRRNDSFNYSSRSGKKAQRPLSMGSLGSLRNGKTKYQENDDLHEDTIDRLIKETL